MALKRITIFITIDSHMRCRCRSLAMPALGRRQEANMRETQSTEADILDLGAASEVTLGIYDPEKTESLVTPDARDF
jgi:hypothetical protein